MDDKVPVAYIVLPILIFLPIFFVLLLGLISFILSAGGWRQLARQYGARAGANGNTTYRVIGFVGSSSYKGAIKVTTTVSGLQIEASPALYIGHTPLFIPFGALRNPRKAAMFLGVDYVVFDVGTPSITQLKVPVAIFKGTVAEVR